MNANCCNGDCHQGRNCPLREQRGVHGGGVARVLLAMLLVALCAVAVVVAK